jgi:hypothetical protein
MKNGLIIVIIVAVVAAAVMLYFYYYYSPETNANGNGNLNANENVNQAVSNTNTVTDFGDIAIDQTVSYKDIDFTFSTGVFDTEFGGEQAEAGKKFVVVYFNTDQAEANLIAKDWIYTDTKLKSSQEAL